MGYDVSYHPISEDEIQQWYFSPLADLVKGGEEAVRALAQQQGMDAFYIEKYIETLRSGSDTTPDEIFEKTHGFYIAVTQGFFRTFFYTRG